MASSTVQNGYPSSFGAACVQILRSWTTEIGQRALGLFRAKGFSGPKVDPQSAEARRARRLGSAGEHLCPPRDLEVDKPSGHDRGFKLSLEESAGDSTLPEIDISSRTLGHRLLHQDISDLEAPSRLEHSPHFP